MMCHVRSGHGFALLPIQVRPFAPSRHRNPIAGTPLACTHAIPRFQQLRPSARRSRAAARTGFRAVAGLTRAALPGPLRPLRSRRSEGKPSGASLGPKPGSCPQGSASSGAPGRWSRLRRSAASRSSAAWLWPSSGLDWLWGSALAGRCSTEGTLCEDSIMSSPNAVLRSSHSRPITKCSTWE